MRRRVQMTASESDHQWYLALMKAEYDPQKPRRRDTVVAALKEAGAIDGMEKADPERVINLVVSIARMLQIYRGFGAGPAFKMALVMARPVVRLIKYRIGSNQWSKWRMRFYHEECLVVTKKLVGWRDWSQTFEGLPSGWLLFELPSGERVRVAAFKDSNEWVFEFQGPEGTEQVSE